MTADSRGWRQSGRRVRRVRRVRVGAAAPDERVAWLRPYELYIGRRTPSRPGYGRSHHKQTMVLSPKSRRSTAVIRAQLDNGGPCELRHAPCCYQPSCSLYSLIALAAMANARFATGTP